MNTEKHTERITMKVKPSIKKAAERRAAEEGRNLSNYIEWLILKDTKKNPGK